MKTLISPRNFRAALPSLVVSATCFFSAAASGQVTFTGLGTAVTFATGVSDDGQYVSGVGYHEPDGTGPASTFGAVRWSAGGGSQSLGNPAGSSSTWASGISADGSVVVGTIYGSTAQAYRWTAETGMVDLGTLPGAYYASAKGVSGDGSVVIGDALFPAPDQHFEAYRWTQGSGNVSLGSLGPGTVSAFTISRDGSTIVGGTVGDAFRWTEATGMQAIGGGSLLATAVSSNGNQIGGVGTALSSENGFLWSETGGFIDLGYDHIPRVISNDGSFVLGNNFAWTPESGIRSLLGVLREDYGLESEMAGWTFLLPFAMSTDGRFVVGMGYKKNVQEGWLLDLGLNPPDILPPGPIVVSPIPEPAVIGGAGATLLGGLLVSRFLARRSRPQAPA